MSEPVRAIDAILGEPWAITERGLKVVLAIADRGQVFADELARARGEWSAASASMGSSATDEPQPRNPLVVENGVAIIEVRGPIFTHADLFTDVSGATSQDGIRSRLRAARAAAAVRAVVLKIHSPGGQAHGVADLADEIRAVDAVKPVEAMIVGQGASAAYWLACGARRITLSQTGEAGSIGAMAAYLDETKAKEMRGERTIYFVSSVSPLKNALPTNDKGASLWQAYIDQLGVKFVEAVARLRGVPAATVRERYGQGNVLLGTDAVTAGLVDRVGAFDQVVSELGAQRSTSYPTVAPGATEVNAMNCSKCGNPIDGEAYCPACYEAAQQGVAESLGLDKGATAQSMRERIAGLVALERGVLAATGATNAAEAQGVLKAAMESHREIGGMRDGIARAERQGRLRDLRTVLEKGLEARPRRLTLGALRTAVPELIEAIDPAAATAWRAALAAVPEKIPEGQSERTLVLDAVCAVDVGGQALRSIGAYARVAMPVAAELADEPARDADGDARGVDELADRIANVAERTRQSMGLNLSPAAK